LPHQNGFPWCFQQASFGRVGSVSRTDYFVAILRNQLAFLGSDVDCAAGLVGSSVADFATRKG